jgi:choline dehydrogenase-like flavoprotein
LIEEAAHVAGGTRVHCDVCIIGAGAAGISMAAELEDSGLGVVLLESGGTEREEDTQALYRGRVDGAPQFPPDLSRLRFLGGTTNHWQGMCRPFDALDFEARAWVPESGWPIGRKALDAWYARAHGVCDLGPYDYTPESWDGVGDPGPRLRTEPDIELKVVQHSKPTRFATKYDALLRRPGGPRVLLHANAYEIVPDASARRVDHVEVRTLEGHRFDVHGRAVVLACGGIENARLLLLSNRVTTTGLGNEAGLVGRYFMDHPGAIPFGVLVYLDPAYHGLTRERRVHDVRVLAGVSLADRVLEREGLLNNALYLREPTTLEKIRDFEWFNIVQSVSHTLDERDLQVARFLESLSPSHAEQRASIAWIRSEQAPDPDSRVKLGEELDALGQRRVVVDWRLPDLNQHTFLRAAELYAHILTRSGVGRVKLMPWLLEDEDEWWRRVTPGWHHIGTTRMAHNANQGVVNEHCRVFGIENLYVAGSSVFPTSSYINPTLTLVALALRLADHLRGALGAGSDIREELPT